MAVPVLNDSLPCAETKVCMFSDLIGEVAALADKTCDIGLIASAESVVASGFSSAKNRDKPEDIEHSLPVISVDPASYVGRRMTAQNVNLILSMGCFYPENDFRFPKTCERTSYCTAYHTF